MIRVNLLPSESIKKEERREFFYLVVALVAVLSLGISVRHVIGYGSYRKLEAKLRATQTELSRYEDIVKQVETLQQTKKVLETKKNVIGSLMASRLIYPRFMEKLLSLLPANVWFTALTTALDGAGKMVVTINSTAMDNYSIADFISVLSTEPDFSNIELGPITTQTTQSGTQKLSLSGFKLTLNYQLKKQ